MINKEYIYVLRFLMFFVFASLKLYSQNTIDSIFTAHGEKLPFEKIHIHFDRSIYHSGDSIWFKAYIFEGSKPSYHSTNIYLELIDPVSHNVLERKKFPIIEYSASGILYIPQEYANSKVMVRAYTPLMLNFDADYLYTHFFKIFQTKEFSNKTSETKKLSTIQFLPEAGSFVNNIINNVAFKAVDENGLPVTCTGEIKDDNGEIITQFNTIHDGMGSFFLKPQQNITYTAHWKDHHNQTYQTVLPKSKTIGVVMKLGIPNNDIPFYIERSQNAPSNLKKLHLLGHSNNRIIYSAEILLENIPAITGRIPIQEHSSGLVTFTLFDEQWKPLLERITFIHKDDFEFKVDINVKKSNLEKRELNSIELSVSEDLLTNMSISIVDVNFHEETSNNILSNLILSGDLKGNVYSPKYYFDKNNKSRFQHLDLVMMTNGWRQYDWDKIVKGEDLNLKYHNENYLTINAKISGVRENRIKKDALLNIILISKYSSNQFITIPYENKKFIKEGLIFFDSVNLKYKFNEDQVLTERSTIDFNTSLFELPNKIELKSYNNFKDNSKLPENWQNSLDEAKERALIDSKIHKVLEQVIVQGELKKRSEILDEKYATGMFKGMDAQIFDLENNEFNSGVLSALSYLRGRIVGMDFSEEEQRVSKRGMDVGILINENPIDFSTANNINLSEIAYIKIFNPPFISSTGVYPGGAIVFYIKKGGGGAYNQEFSNMKTIYLKGYDSVKQFYSPNYSESSLNNLQIDLRKTLYWNPYIFTDKENNIQQIQFYNNDITKEYKIIVEGVSQDGKITSTEKVVRL